MVKYIYEGFKKLWLNKESNIGLLESYTCPFELFFSLLKINSSPVEITDTFNLLYTSISSVPDAASCAISAELSNFPLFTTTSPLAVCLHAIKQAGKIFGSKVLITGSGPIGTLCVAAARRAGAQEIIVTDISTNALKFSNSVGADKVINVYEQHDELKNYQSNKGYFDIAIECSGSAQGISDSINCIKPKGTLIQLGLGGDVLIPLVSVTTKELNLKGSFRFHSEFELAVKMMKKKLIDVNPLITHKIDFKDAINGFEIAMNNNEKSMKVQLAF